MSQVGPKVSVVVRSYNRLEMCLELLERVLKQRYDNFEVVVIEQSTQASSEHLAALESLAARESRLRLIRTPPLGAAGARNEGWRQAIGEVVLFIDDDDLPVDDLWIANHAANYANPLCVAATGREVRTVDEDPTPHNTWWNRRTCLRYTFLKIPRARTRHTFRIEGVTMLQGGNTSVRREVIERVGGWDELTESTDENSFDFRFDKLRRPGEFFVYDPKPAILRRLVLTGGLERRPASAARVLSFELFYSHHLVRRYYPGRFYAFYPAYLVLAFKRAACYVRDNHRDWGWGQVLWDTLRAFPSVLRAAWK